ncbi:MAG TPA: tetratricopeptide repeat protein [Kofleriaceae bacterium]|nr:tetratricopeptide repeat protein [Kofleriaceae bacterium]
MIRAATIAAVLTVAAHAWAQPGGAPGAPPPPKGTPHPVDDATRRAWMKEAEELMEHYSRASSEQEARMRAILVREYNRRLTQLDDRYSKRMQQADELKKRKQLEAIALLEKFVKDHPKHPVYTPDARYRLAALYLDQAEMVAEAAGAEVDADYGKSLEQWEIIIREFPDYRQIAGTLYLYATYIGTRQPVPPEEERRAVQVFRALVCANKYKPFDPPPPTLTREEVLKRLETKTLTDPYQGCEPVKGADKELVMYGWVRGVGANHFATPGEMDEAIAAYRYGLDDPDHKLYDEALYMTAWSYYRRDILDEAIKLFDKSVARYDKIVAAGGKPSLKLREEALQYIAVAFTDPWEGELETDPVKAFARAEAFYKGRENEPHVRDVWIVLGKAFTDLGRAGFDQAIMCYQKAIGPPWNLHPDAPLVHEEIVNVLERKGDKLEANNQRSEIATRYSPCPEDRKRTRTPEDPCGRWYEANETNRKAMDNYNRIGERMLIVAAVQTHLAAVEKHNEWLGAKDGTPEKDALKAERDELLTAAITHYRTFLRQYPMSKEVYGFTFNLADALFLAGRYVDQPGADGVVSEDEEGAVRHYEWVRDHRALSTEFYSRSNYMIAKSWELYASWLVAQGNAGYRPLELPDLKVKPLPGPIDMPEAHRKLQEAYDACASLPCDPPPEEPDPAGKRAAMGFNAGLISLAYYHLDDAIVRMTKAMKTFCGQPQGLRAKENILAIHEARGDDAAFRKVNNDFINQSCGDATAIALAKDQNRKLEFKIAERMVDEGKFAEAAQAFYQYYYNAPVNDDSRAAALYNAAQLYEDAGQPRRALYLFKEFSEKAESTAKENKAFRDSGYRLPAMELYAESYGNDYDYAAAAKKYMEIYDRASNPAKYGVKPPTAFGDKKPRTFDQIKRDSLFNAAAFLELDRNFPQAIQYYQRYESIETDPRKKDRALWAIARMYHSAENVDALARAYSDWRKKYGLTEGNEVDNIYSFYDLARMYGKRNGSANQKDAASYRLNTIKAWEQVSDASWQKLTAEERVRAARMAGEYDFGLIERDNEAQWKHYKLPKARDPKAATPNIAAMQKMATALIDRYDTVGKKYGKYINEYRVAGEVRIGEIYLDYIQKIFEMPAPSSIAAKGPMGLEAWETVIRKEIDKLGYKDKAKQSFEAVVQFVNDPKVKVSKKWVAIAKDNLNKEFGANYPILNEELAEGTDEP